MVDVAHHGDHRGTGPQFGLVHVLVVVEELGQQLGFALLAGVDQTDLAPISAANRSIMSSVSDWVAVTISPCRRRKRMTSPADRLSLGPRSLRSSPVR